jgi:hypothetical protein
MILSSSIGSSSWPGDFFIICACFEIFFKLQIDRFLTQQVRFLKDFIEKSTMYPIRSIMLCVSSLVLCAMLLPSLIFTMFPG